MAARLKAKIDTIRTPHSHAGDERCPLCNQTLPHDLSAAELQAKLREHEQKAAQAQEQRLRTHFAQEMTTKIAETKRQSATEAAEREKVIRLEVKKQTTAEMNDELSKAKRQTQKAQQEKQAAEERMKRLKDEQEAQIKAHTKKALAEQREALDKERGDAVAKAKADEFEKNQKLQRQVEVLKRQLEEKTADSLGEGAEVDLYEPCARASMMRATSSRA